MVQIKRVVCQIYLSLIAGCLSCVFVSTSILASPNNSDLPNHTQRQIIGPNPKIQLAILLDTSSSMDGLIDQARNQLWKIVNEFSKATKEGVKPAFQVAIYEYGNDNLSAEMGYIRQVTDLTSDLDQLSEALFSLTTQGGEEYCGLAIDTAVKKLQWSSSDNDIKAIFIAGNEAFSQGPLAYRDAIRSAKRKGIIVNTIHAGDSQEGAQGGWQEAALLALGSYMSIDHNQKIVHLVAPQDMQIADLNRQLNATYIPYGSEGQKGVQRQMKQDSNSQGVSSGLLAKRAKSKSNGMYNNAVWDLADALSSGLELKDIDDAALPVAMRAMDEGEKQKFVADKIAKRKQIQKEIVVLSEAREQFVTAKKAEESKADSVTIDAALIAAVRKQGKEKQFIF